MKIITKTIFIDGFLDKQQYPLDLNIFLIRNENPSYTLRLFFFSFAESKENTWVAEYNEGIGSIASVNGLVTHGDRFM